MSEWISRSQIRQRPMLAVYAGLLILIALIIGIAVLLWLSSPSSDRLTVVANLLSFGTLLLALVAGIVALAAYSAATGLPNLRLKFIEPITSPRSIIFATADRDNYSDPEPEDIAIPGDDNIIRISVENTTNYAARTPAVILEFRGCAIRQNMYAATNAWTATQRVYCTGDVQAVQWDGGPNYAIHGKSIRHLPEINLQGLYAIPDDDDPPEMIVRLLADGYSRQAIRLDISFVAKSKKPPGMEPKWL